MVGEDYYKGLNIKTTEAMHYQPVYTVAVKNPILDLKKTHPVVGASSTCFINLGCGIGVRPYILFVQHYNMWQPLA
jgi:hypothetical protein